MCVLVAVGQGLPGVRGWGGGREGTRTTKGNVDTAFFTLSHFSVSEMGAAASLLSAPAAWRAATPFPTRAGLCASVAFVQALWVYATVAPPHVR